MTQDELDAKRWRAFLAANRIRRLGYSMGKEGDANPLYAYIGMEIWTEYGTNMDQSVFEEGNKEMQELLTEFADRMIKLQESK